MLCVCWNTKTVGFIESKNPNFHSFSPPPCSTTLQWVHGVPIRPRFDDSPSKISRRWRIPTRRHVAMQFNQVQNAAGSSTLLSQKKKNSTHSWNRSILAPVGSENVRSFEGIFMNETKPKIDSGSASVCYDLFKLCDTTDAARDVTTFVGSSKGRRRRPAHALHRRLWESAGRNSSTADVESSSLCLARGDKWFISSWFESNIFQLFSRQDFGGWFWTFVLKTKILFKTDLQTLLFINKCDIMIVRV